MSPKNRAPPPRREGAISSLKDIVERMGAEVRTVTATEQVKDLEWQREVAVIGVIAMLKHRRHNPLWSVSPMLSLPKRERKMQGEMA